jgi:hypothetical protein
MDLVMACHRSACPSAYGPQAPLKPLLLLQLFVSDACDMAQ